MTAKKIKVPEGMLKAAEVEWESTGARSKSSVRGIVEAALRWQSENPIVPSESQAREFWTYFSCLPPSEFIQKCIQKWQREMYDVPVDESGADAVKDLFVDDAWDDGNPWPALKHMKIYNHNVLEAYRRGRDSMRAAGFGDAAMDPKK